jgi:general secretion pathway protein D
VADEDTNSLMVMTAPKNFERVKAVLAELDRDVPQVLIKVLIAEVTHDNSRDLGAEFSVLNLRANGNGPQIGTDFGIAQQTGGLVFKVTENDFTAAIRALDTVGKLDVLSRPYILASDNQLASITVGQEVPFITNTRTTDTGQTINTIQYQDIGIILDVVPHINPDGLVIMDVAPEISALTGTTVPISETVTAPVFAKRSAQSRVSIRDGQTIVIGGLMEDRKTSSVQKVPLIGDIPIVGALFRRNQTTISKTELLIFLTPHVASRPDFLKAMSKDELEGAKIVPNAVDKNAFRDQLEGLRRGSATQPVGPAAPDPGRKIKD